MDFRASIDDRTPSRVEVARRMSITTLRSSVGSANLEGGGVLNVALEGSHVHLISATDGVVDPEPRANAFAVRTSWKSGDVEGLELTRNAVSYDGNDDKVGGLNITDV